MTRPAKHRPVIAGAVLFLVLVFAGGAPVTGEGYTVTWLGVAGLCICDGETTLLIDPYISRYSLFDIMFNRDLSCDECLVADWLDRHQISNVNAVILTETHYDHACDAATVAALCDAPLVGSVSAANIGLGAGLPSNRIDIVKYGDTRTYSKFTVEFMKSRHTPLVGDYQLIDGEISAPLCKPAGFRSYKMGGHYAIFIQHPAGNIITHMTPFDDQPDREWQDLDIQAVFLPSGSRRNYDIFLRQVIEQMAPRELYPIHFDNFFAPMPDNPADLRPWCIMGLRKLQRAMKRRSPPCELVVPEPYAAVHIGDGS